MQKNELDNESMRSSLNPFIKFSRYLKKKDKKKRDKEFQMRLAILTGGIIKMK
jgi:hypothetical protein